MLLQPRKDICDVKNRSFRGTHWVDKRLKGDCAEVERQSFERTTRCICLDRTRTSAGRVGIFRGPFAMCDLSNRISKPEIKKTS